MAQSESSRIALTVQFANEDRLRLLPKCKHAFHLDCIDTWLLSNSTCPLCQRSLLPEAESAAPPIDGNGPTGLSVDSQGASHSRRHGSFRGSSRLNIRGSFRFLTDAMAPSLPPPSSETDITPSIFNPAVVDVFQASPLSPGPTVCGTEPGGSEKVSRVELGKVNTDPRRIARDTDNSQGPRSYSMGSCEYVVSLTRLGLAMP
ncbi:uncharacterized protein [Physcomitrium patens]|uniref:RING-type domain-containing protein n=1 Tax=Physcomitrium patens TaxID=3218 RepID=A9SFB1_PHYPA|nr:E3 ubiquitin-protein ligase ATL4-like [Physcomitrium patens]PNR28186.1 hypothetical protein PHYPA_028778 [Physcomitrium patens]|eukprot:XP_024364492.1 E3 ubiquitin-protein ligase ATL4-like [Physcomitrella patens]